MSWDASLIKDPCPTCRDGGEVFSTNYTHNTNPMIAAVIEGFGPDVRTHFLVGKCWWEHLDGKSGVEGRDVLDAIITGLRADPDRFRAMNPSNGWGNYDDLVALLVEMRNAVDSDTPSRWSVNG